MTVTLYYTNNLYTQELHISEEFREDQLNFPVRILKMVDVTITCHSCSLCYLRVAGKDMACLATEP